MMAVRAALTPVRQPTRLLLVFAAVDAAVRQDLLELAAAALAEPVELLRAEQVGHNAELCR